MASNPIPMLADGIKILTRSRGTPADYNRPTVVRERVEVCEVVVIGGVNAA